MPVEVSYTTWGLMCIAVVLPVCWLITQNKRKRSWEFYGVKDVRFPAKGFVDFSAGCAEVIAQHGDTVGVSGFKMMLISRDVELLRQILVKDFNNFTDRAVSAATVSPVKHGLFFLEGKNWRRMRHILSPSFTTGKLKHMCPTIDQAARRLTSVLESLAKKGELLPVKKITGQYTSEIIARTGFGLETHCLGEEDDEFTRLTKGFLKIHNPFMNAVIMALIFVPTFHSFLAKTLRLGVFDHMDLNADKYFKHILTTTVTERQDMMRRGDTTPKDLLQSLIQAKELGDHDAEAMKDVATSESWDDLPKNMSEEELMGQSMLILFAGFETTSTTLQFCLYLLAQHQDVQEKVYQEILTQLQSDTPTHEELNKLTYMEQVVDETLRLYPPIPIITRKALETKTYGGVTIPKGTWIMAVLEQVMKDPKHFPEPDKFDPERFSEENVSKRDSLSFLPFGSGPRLCIGMRLAYLELKMALVHVLRKIKVELNDKTEPKPDQKPKITFHVILVADKPIELALTLRDQ
ncbi:cytochrome P450 3A24-like [Biomphalaria glabrata]|uniref:Cytochrome P450 3A24-like n=1 Tax=Biomphalaria glabrata TaxID=6526 RepID=A0A9W3AT11_BIOGL|nr:cytochrome P450 3A24-like [Biomphalaria glabrata]XP_055890426.1 cytochrome P450 3A24-like [Biomphalaria glabrata]XP_055890428.1 cytochrome P450 3A24-like [Biomphalaria glabrata]